jgi:hypothetical protein
MSNRSVLESLERELDKYLAGSYTADEISRRLDSHIEALEGIPYSVVVDMRHYRYLLETQGAYEEEGCQSKSDDVVSSIRIWLRKLTADYT